MGATRVKYYNKYNLYNDFSHIIKDVYVLYFYIFFWWRGGELANKISGNA